MLTSTTGFIRYFESIRERTLRFIAAIPPEQIDFSRHPGKYTLGDIIRHLASTERMFIEAMLEGRFVYPGHGRELGATLEEAVSYLATCHAEAMQRLAEASDSLVDEKRPTLGGPPISAWRILMMMVEHEVHHRSQISQYLVDLGIAPPQIFGKYVEELPTA
jgi:uncharacterized damage-inducible protein DinB